MRQSTPKPSQKSNPKSSPSLGVSLAGSVFQATARLTGVGARVQVESLRHGPQHFGFRIAGHRDLLGGVSVNQAVMDTTTGAASVSGSGVVPGSAASHVQSLFLQGSAEALTAALRALEYRPDPHWAGAVNVVVRVWRDEPQGLAKSGGGVGGGAAAVAGAGGGVNETMAVVPVVIEAVVAKPVAMFRGVELESR